MRPTLQIAEPAVPIDPINEPDAALEWIEKLIVEAERQISGLQRGGERMEAAVDVASRTLGRPCYGNREVSRLAVQLIYSRTVRGLPPEYRSSTQPPAPNREDP
jgi:hypothetical protein